MRTNRRTENAKGVKITVRSDDLSGKRSVSNREVTDQTNVEPRHNIWGKPWLHFLSRSFHPT